MRIIVPVILITIIMHCPIIDIAVLIRNFDYECIVCSEWLQDIPRDSTRREKQIHFQGRGTLTYECLSLAGGGAGT